MRLFGRFLIAEVLGVGGFVIAVAAASLFSVSHPEPKPPAGNIFVERYQCLGAKLCEETSPQQLEVDTEDEQTAYVLLVDCHHEWTVVGKGDGAVVVRLLMPAHSEGNSTTWWLAPGGSIVGLRSRCDGPEI